MATHRKAMAEIDGQLKKVREKFDAFDELHKKVQSAANPTARTRMEEEFKKQFKGLVRLREKIRGCIGNSEYKERESSLESARKKIEDYMEVYKSWEKEAKTKAFSKEGLASAKIDKKAEEKAKTSAWLNEGLQRLSDMRNSCEAEIENKESSKRKPKRGKSAERSLEVCKEKLEEIQLQMRRVELMLRSLENEAVSSERLNEIRDSFENYLSSNIDDYARSIWETKYRNIEGELLPDDLVQGEFNSEEDKEAAVATVTGQSPNTRKPGAAEASNPSGKELLPPPGLPSMSAGEPQTFFAQNPPPEAFLSAPPNYPPSADRRGLCPPTVRSPPPVFSQPPMAGQVQRTMTPVQAILQRNPRSASPSRPEKVPISSFDVLALSRRNVPRPQDSAIVAPANPVPLKKSSVQFPTVPMQASPDLFNKFDDDTLFFIFHYQQNTYEQFLAVKELKRRSWEYNTKYYTWFQRHEDPKSPESKENANSYIYFDYDSGWCQRIKKDFVLESQFLESEVTPQPQFYSAVSID